MTRVLANFSEIVQEFTRTLERYHSAIRAGVFTSADKLELLYGKLVDLTPKGSPHREVEVAQLLPPLG